MDMHWQDEAKCLTEDPELFFPVGNTGPAVDQIDQAKAICRECAVSTSCLEYSRQLVETAHSRQMAFA